MQLNNASRHAITALVYLVREKPTDAVPSHKIARTEGIPESFLARVLQPLADVGILSSVKGPNGGYHLARAPKDITLLEVVEAVDGALLADAGAVGKEGAALDKRLQAVCDGVVAVVRERLGKVTLAELARGK
jgi:Rrf2 family protein